MRPIRADTEYAHIGRARTGSKTRLSQYLHVPAVRSWTNINNRGHPRIPMDIAGIKYLISRPHRVKTLARWRSGPADSRIVRRPSRPIDPLQQAPSGQTGGRERRSPMDPRRRPVSAELRAALESPAAGVPRKPSDRRLGTRGIGRRFNRRSESLRRYPGCRSQWCARPCDPPLACNEEAHLGKRQSDQRAMSRCHSTPLPADLP